MKRIRFHYSCYIAGSDGYEDHLVEDDTDLDDYASQVMFEIVMPQWRHEEITDDDDSWEGA